MSLPDMLERLESAAERQYDEMYVDAEHYRCGCGEITSNNDMNFIDPNPYSPPCCGKCWDEFMKDWEKKR